MSISVQALGRFFLAGATLFAPANNFSILADEQKTSATEDASNPDYLKGKNLEKEIKKALEDPDSEFTQKLFSNPALTLNAKLIKQITSDKFIDTLAAKSVGERSDFPFTKEYLKMMDEKSDTKLAEGFRNNLSGKVNQGKVITVTDVTLNERIKRAEVPVLVDFWAPWCGVCIGIEPMLKDIAHERNGELIILKLNVDNNPATRNQYPVITGAVPVLMLFKDGKQIVEDLPVEGRYTKDKIANALKESLK